MHMRRIVRICTDIYGDSMAVAAARVLFKREMFDFSVFINYQHILNLPMLIVSTWKPVTKLTHLFFNQFHPVAVLLARMEEHWM